MDEVEPGTTAAAASPASAGSILLAARNAAGLSLAEVGARTRIPLRHLEAIETGKYVDLPSTTYAVGFAKAYARAVGADEVQVATIVRQEVAKLGRRQPEYTPYEIADPARVPSRGVAVVGVGIALAVLILIGLWYGTNLFRGGGAQPAQPAPVFTPAAVATSPKPSAAAPAAQQVTLTASDEVWLRVHDADKTLFQGTMKAGDHFDVPATATNPTVDVARPDKLSVTLNGSAVPPLSSGARAIKDVPVGGGALAARAAGATPTATPSAAAGPLAAPMPSSSTVTPKRSTAAAPKRDRKPDRPKKPAKSKRHLTETQRANLQSAANPPPPAPVDDTP